MTREEYRAKCIKAIMACMGWENSLGKRLAAKAILDALHGIVRVVPKVATKEMSLAVMEQSVLLSTGAVVPCEPYNSIIFATMVAIGDLTNAPEKTP